MFGFLFAFLLVVAVVVVLSRKRGAPRSEDEPWRASLREADDDEPLDIEEARRAEDEWEAAGGNSWEEDDEGWRG